MGAVPLEFLKIVPAQLKTDGVQQLVKLNASLVVATMLKKDAKHWEERSQLTFP